MAIRIAINGFGRIGRNVLRAGWHRSDIEFVHVNDLVSPAMLAYLLRRDSVHGTFEQPVEAVDGGIRVGDRVIPVTAERDPTKLPWKSTEVDVVLECTGALVKRDQAAQHLTAGAKRVIISAPAKGDVDATIVMGVN
ncbi:MAG: glyceraldehyde 3-phosphate dehydrogenase NAD-binding domain-containing protein, partial [Myxococcota bacterium]